MADFPYSGCNFFTFFVTLCKRLFVWQTLASDEIQMLVLIGISLSGALVGSFLVLRKMTMLANALSHTILLGIVIAFLLTHQTTSLSLSSLVIASLASALVTTFLAQFLTRVTKLQEDASIGLVFSGLFALGIVLISLFARDLHLGTELVMGNVDALQLQDLKITYGVLLCNLILFLLLFRGFALTSFDEGLARAFGLSSTLFSYLLMLAASMTAIAAFRSVGVLMILAFFTLPTLTARTYTHSLPKLIALSCAIGAGISIVGVALSRHILTTLGIGLSTGALVVCLLFALYLFSQLTFARKMRMLASYETNRRHGEHRIGRQEHP